VLPSIELKSCAEIAHTTLSSKEKDVEEIDASGMAFQPSGSCVIMTGDTCQPLLTGLVILKGACTVEAYKMECT
jgi:hypothetical protein